MVNFQIWQHHQLKRFSQTWWNTQVRESSASILERREIILVSNYHGSKELNTTLFDRHYSPNCKAITFRKITSHTKYKKPNVPNYPHISWFNFSIKRVIVSSISLVLAETDFQNLPGVLSRRLRPWLNILRFNAFSGNVNTINWKDFPKYGQRKINKHSGAARNKTLSKLKKYERMYLWS